VQDGKLETSVVNSLFGDGAAGAAVICNQATPEEQYPAVLDFSSHIVSKSLDTMKFDWDDQHGKFSFFLGKHVPYVIGANVEEAVGRLLSANQLRKSAINHWVIHSGGKKVIDSIKINLGLSSFDVRHTSSVLKDFGNVSSGSFLFSFQRLLAERSVSPGDLGVMITMGPGATIETALLQF
jgi:predicted naringenin-chalcone synthase